MRNHVTVVPADQLLIVDGEALRFGYPAPAHLRAVQWSNGQGHMEFTDDYNHQLDAALYAEEVAPFVALWEAEKARRVSEAEATEAARLAEYNKPENARARKATEINQGCETALAALTATYPERELLTFERQEREARALLAGGRAAAVPHITAIALGRGISVEDLAQKIVDKADAFSLAAGALIGQRQWYEDALEALGPDATTAQIENITVHYSLAAVAPQGALGGDSSALLGTEAHRGEGAAS